MKRRAQGEDEGTYMISTPQTNGQVIHTPRLYELIVWAITRGKEDAFRRFCADLAELKAGEAVLDVGCGVGTMALAAKSYVGAAGRVVGIEPSREMVVYAREKAKRRKAAVEFRQGVIERLDFTERTFDAIFCLIVMHHMPDESKIQGIQEMARVLKPGGRLVVVDSNLNLLPSFENSGFVLVKEGKAMGVSGYDFRLWKLGEK